MAVAAAYDRWRGRDFDTHTDQALDMVGDDEWTGTTGDETHPPPDRLTDAAAGHCRLERAAVAHILGLDP